MRSRNLVATALLSAFLSAHSLNAAITIVVDTTDELSGNFQIDVLDSETFLGVDMPEVNSFSIDGTGFATWVFSVSTSSGDITLAEYNQAGGLSMDPADLLAGSDSGTISAAQTGGRAVQYSFTNVATDTLTIFGDFSFTAVPESSQWGPIAGGACLVLVGLRRRR